MSSLTAACGLLSLALTASMTSTQPVVGGNPTPTDAIGGIVAAFATHAIVALPDAHGNQQSHGFLLSLIRDPRFIRTVNDIVVEFGNARYQDLADRFVRGEEVPYESLRLVWRNHTQPSISADFTHHEEFFKAVKAVNAAAPAGRTLRVLLGDPPIDWDAIRNKDEHFKWIEMRDAHPAAILQTEVIARGHRALLVYGTGHLQRKNVLSNFEMNDWRAQTIVSLVERAGPTRVFAIAGVDGRHVAGWKAPALVLIHGTALGALDASEYFGWRGRFAAREGKLVAIPQEEWRTLRADEQFDALLFLGVPPAAAGDEPLSPGLCTEPGYVEMRLKRIALAGLPPPEVERVKLLCAGKTR
jgi:hypothetical protein